MEDLALVLSTLANLKVCNSLLVKATGGAVGEIYFFTHHLYWLLTSTENSLTSLQYNFHRCIHQQSCSGQDAMGESSFPGGAAGLQLVALFLLCRVASSPLVCAHISSAHEPHKKFVSNQWKQPRDLSKLTEIIRKTH